MTMEIKIPFKLLFAFIAFIASTCIVYFVSKITIYDTVIYLDHEIANILKVDNNTELVTSWPNYYKKMLQDIQIDPEDLKTNITCDEVSDSDIEQNMQKVLSYSVIQQMRMKHPDMFSVFDQQNQSMNKFPVIVTAASSNHYNESLAMINSVKKTMMIYNVKLVIFDLGLTKSQRSSLRNFCNCKIRTFPFHKYPSFISSLNNYAWKPLVIYTMLKEYNFVIWADASVNFQGTKENILRFFMLTKKVGILMQKLHFRTLFYTKLDTFRYLNENACLFDFRMLGATFISFWKTNFTWKYIIQPWIACAMTKNCMSDENPNEALNCHNQTRENMHALHVCHRFDQSVLTVIIQKIFNAKYSIVDYDRIPSIATIARGQYFNGLTYLENNTIASAEIPTALGYYLGFVHRHLGHGYDPLFINVSF